MASAALLLGNVKAVIAVIAIVAVMNFKLRFMLSPSVLKYPVAQLLRVWHLYPEPQRFIEERTRQVH